MLSHDYSMLSGVRKAVDEFLATRPEKPIELPSTQCMIVKLGDVA
jgi:O-methyltransferase